MSKTFSGIIKRSTGSWYEVLLPDGTVYHCRLAGKHRLNEENTTNFLAVGDQVNFIGEENKIGWIKEKLERKSKIMRRSNKAGSYYHVIAANIDQLVITATLKFPVTPPGFIDRLLVSAEIEEITPIIIFNKKDLRTNVQQKKFESLQSIYTSAGYKVLNTSALSSEGIEEVKKELRDKTSLFAGHSGVGKSSLLNRIHPELNLKTKSISAATNKGKHATTFAEMHQLSANTYVIDAPGIRDFGITDLEKPELSHYFPEMRNHIQECRFNDCLHKNEPDCKIKELLNEGELSQERYDSYLRILDNMD